MTWPARTEVLPALLNGPVRRVPSSTLRLPVALLLKGTVTWALPPEDLRTRPALTNWEPEVPPMMALPWRFRVPDARLAQVALFCRVTRPVGVRVVAPPVSTTVPEIVTRLGIETTPRVTRWATSMVRVLPITLSWPVVVSVPAPVSRTVASVRFWTAAAPEALSVPAVTSRVPAPDTVLPLPSVNVAAALFSWRVEEAARVTAPVLEPPPFTNSRAPATRSTVPVLFSGTPMLVLVVTVRRSRPALLNWPPTPPRPEEMVVDSRNAPAAR